MRILVTGGAGFIGSHVVKMLQEHHTVDLIDSHADYGVLDRSDLDVLIGIRTHGIRGRKYVGDIRDRDLIARVFQEVEPEVVVHLAAFPRAAAVSADPVTGSEVMSAALLDLLVVSKNHDVKRFVYASSSMVYGDFESGVTEVVACKPKGTYGILKLAGELLVQDFCVSHGFEYVIVRPSAVYGPMDVKDRVVSRFLINAMNNQTIVVNGADEVLDFTNVTDTAAGICLAAEVERARNGVFNIASGIGHSLLEAAQLAVCITGSTSRVEVNERDRLFPSRSSLSIDRARTELGFAPHIHIEEGFSLYHDWLRHSIYGR